MTSTAHISLGELFPDAPPPRLTLRPNPQDGADLTFYTTDGRGHKIHLPRCCVLLILLLFRSLKRATDDDEYSAFRDATRLRDEYCAVQVSLIQASNIPSYVLKTNKLLRAALKGLGLQEDRVVDLIVSGYRLGVDDLQLTGPLKGAEQMTNEELGRLLRLRPDSFPGRWA